MNSSQWRILRNDRDAIGIPTWSNKPPPRSFGRGFIIPVHPRKFRPVLKASSRIIKAAVVCPRDLLLGEIGPTATMERLVAVHANEAVGSVRDFRCRPPRLRMDLLPAQFWISLRSAGHEPPIVLANRACMSQARTRQGAQSCANSLHRSQPHDSRAARL
jgi:hypothetical protein